MTRSSAMAEGNDSNPNHAAYLVPGLERGLRVLEALAEAGRPLGLTEIGARLGVTRSSVFRLVYTLRHMGFLEEVEGAKGYRLGARVLNLGFAYLTAQDIIETARPELELLRDRTGVTTHLAIRDGAEVLYLSCIQTRTGFLSNMNVGSRLPAYASPMGWLLMADLSPREVATLFAGTTLTPWTEQTPADLATLLARIGAAAASGHVVSRGIMEPGGSSIAASVFARDGTVAAAIDISGPDSAFDFDAFDERYVPEVRAAAARISARLGHAGAVSPAPPPASRTAASRSPRSPHR
ncbi:IclR family transcriptional regulator [Roseomonas sp. CAU 1739]|uniref:IclR family transcriptional regulator n=1 Tax=Roseomonas sp. CAU 1739 TaxID=3140364 RepID=UPI00325B3F59